MALYWLIPIGFFAGAFGTLIGAGGGFVLMPILLLLYRDSSPVLLTSISLAVIFFNALSGTLAYARMRRIDYKSGLLFLTATLPGSIAGALTTSWMPRWLFDFLFGLLLIAAAVFLLLKKETAVKSEIPGKWTSHIQLTEADGTSHRYSYSRLKGFIISLAVGYVSTLLGIGGGIIHVPVMVYMLHFPVHIATATSHFVLAGMSLTGSMVHLFSGVFAQGGARRILCLSAGVILGAQLGALLAGKVGGHWIIRGLAFALGIVGIRILLLAFRCKT
jgi:uncharacterized protein